MNILPGQVTEGAVALKGMNAHITAPPGTATGEVLVGVRPQELLVGETPGAALTIEAPVTVVEPLGSETFVHVEIGGAAIIGSTPGREAPEVGATIRLSAPTESLHFFDARTERTLHTG